MLRPTTRADGSEPWFTWNPRRKSDAVDEFFRSEKPDNAIIVKANYSDNPFFPSVLEEEMQLDRQRYPGRSNISGLVITPKHSRVLITRAC